MQSLPTKRWREVPLMGLVAGVVAAGIVIGYDRYTSPDRISEKPLLDMDYVDVVDGEVHYETGLDQFFQEELIQELEPRHGAPTHEDFDKKLNTLCYAFRDVCDRVTLVGAMTAKERYFYTSIPIYLVHYFDVYGSFDHPIEHFLSSIHVSSREGRRGYANHDSIVMNISNIETTREYLEIMTHELGHIVDLGAVTGTMKRRDTTYTEFGQVLFSLDDPSLDYYRLSWTDESTRKADQTRDDFCSGYGQRNPFEDFSECMNLYINHHDLFVHITDRSRTLESKYAYIKRLFDGFYLYRDTPSVRKYSDPSTFYVFDTSKIWK